MSNKKFEFSKLFMKSDAQEKMVEYRFGHRFHDLKYYEVDFFFMFLACIVFLKASSQSFV